MCGDRVVVPRLGALSIRSCSRLIHPLERSATRCASWPRATARSMCRTRPRRRDRRDGRYLGVIKKAGHKFDRIRKDRDDATAEELRRLTEMESEREELRASRPRRWFRWPTSSSAPWATSSAASRAASSQLQATASSMASAAEQSAMQSGDVSASLNEASAGVDRRGGGERRVRDVDRRDQPPGSTSAELARKARARPRRRIRRSPR
jgi:hypothetical protein